MNERENIIVLFPDQLRFDALSCNGCRAINTPNLDKLALEGINFKQAISPTPLCVPARASLMTGVDSIETGVIDNFAWLRPDRKDFGYSTWPEVLSDVGYNTAAIGKMHFYPWDLNEGFDLRVIAEDKRHIYIEDDYQMALKNHGFKRFHGKESEGYFEYKGAIIDKLPKELQIDNWVCDRSIEYLKSLNENESFAMIVGFPGPHCPYDPLEEYLDKVDVSKIELADKNTESWMVDEAIISNKRPWNGIDYSDMNDEDIIKIRHHYLALVKQIDDCVGRIIKHLETSGLDKNTTIIFTSDHGDFLGDRGLIGKRYFYDSAVHIPMIIKGKGYSAGSINSKPICLTDIYGTILNIAEIKTSFSCLSVDSVRSKPIFGFLDSGYFVVSDKWRYSRYKNGKRYLYNIIDDPKEQNNLIDKISLKILIEDIETKLMKWISNSLITSNSDKRLIPGDGNPEHLFYQRDWKRPYPGNKSLGKNLIKE